MRTALLIILGCLSLGCETRLEELSTPPPGAVATIDEPAETIELTRGAALAFECFYENRPCEGASVTIADLDVAFARETFFDELETNLHTGTQARSVFVIVGRDAGITEMRVQHDDARVAYELTVVDPP